MLETRIHEPILSTRQLKRIARFGLDRRIRRAAAALESRSYSDLKDVDHYLNVLDSPVGVRLKHRMVAADALRFANLTPEQQIRVDAIARAIVAGKHVAPLGNFVLRSFNIGWRYMACLGIAYWYQMIVLTGTIYGNLHAFLSFLATVFLITMVVPVWSIVQDQRKYRRLREVSAALLGEYGGPASIGILLATKGDRNVWRYAGPSLVHVLSRLTVGDYGEVPPTSIALLRNALQPMLWESDADEWMPLILESVGKVGTGYCVYPVQNLAYNSSTPEWREHATRILPILVERQRIEADASRLLRAAEAGIVSDSLLRPLEAGNVDTRKNLLQPVDQPENVVLTGESKPHG
jgi:hypothetical protein